MADKNIDQDLDVVQAWIIDIHSTMCDGDGIRFEFGNDSCETCSVHKLWLDENQTTKHEYICQWSDLAGLADELELIATLLRRHAAKEGQE